MPQSFTTTKTDSLPDIETTRRRVLVTGAAGRIGSYFAAHSHARYRLRLMVYTAGKENGAEVAPYGEVVEGDIGDPACLKTHCEGMDTVLHLAALASPASTWQQVLETNIIGTYNVFVAAKAAGCRRVVFASSIHAVSGYPKDVQVKTSEPVNPGDVYGVSKCFGEALARYMAEQEGLSSLVLRIGAFQPPEAAESDISMLDHFVSQRDLNSLIERAIDTEKLHFAILHGVSNNRFKRLDISDTRALVGYEPQDDSTQLNQELRKLNLSERVPADNLSDGTESGLREDLDKLKQGGG